ncbi:MAG: ABC transporter permease [Rhizobiaceae bacterium]
MTDEIERRNEPRAPLPAPKQKVAPYPRERRLHSGNKIVPTETIAGQALVFVIAIMAFLACLTLGSVTIINQTASDWQGDISREVTIQIRPFDNVEMDTAIRTASKIALNYKGVSKVTVLNDNASAKLLEPWLGTGLNIEELPLPRLLTVVIDRDKKPDFVSMRAELLAKVPGSSLDDHRNWIDRLNTMAWAMVMIGVSILALVMAATVLIVVFATRGAMAGSRDVVEVLHFVGADAGFISNEFQQHFLQLGLKGAASGASAAATLFIGLGLWSSASDATPQGDQIKALFGTFSLGWTGYAGIFIVLALITFLTALTTRITVQRYVNSLYSYNSTGE